MVAGAASKRVPMVIRVLCAAVLIFFYLALLALILFVAFFIEETIVKVICFVLALLNAIGGICVARIKIKDFKKRKEASKEETDDD